MSENTKSKESLKQDANVIRVGVDFVLKQCLYRGKQHNIYLGIKFILSQAVRISRPELFYIIKLMNQHLEQVYYEEKMLRKLDKMSSVPQIILKGDERLQGQVYHYHVYPKLGPSLKLCFNFMARTFLTPTVAMLAIQSLSILEKLHSRLLVHRNIKPKKILTQTPSENQQRSELFLIDFRYTAKYRSKNGKFSSFSENKKFQNKQFVNKFSSLNTHLGLPCSPKDDLESLGYVLVYFLKKGLLFTKEGKNKEEQMKNIQEQKINLIYERSFKDLPPEITQYFQYVRMTNISQYPFPDYDFLKKIFRQILQKYNCTEKDYLYEWIYKMNENNDPFKKSEPDAVKYEEPYDQSVSQASQESQVLTVGAMDSDDETNSNLSIVNKMSDINELQARFKDYLNKP